MNCCQGCEDAGGGKGTKRCACQELCGGRALFWGRVGQRPEREALRGARDAGESGPAGPWHPTASSCARLRVLGAVHVPTTGASRGAWRWAPTTGESSGGLQR